MLSASVFQIELPGHYLFLCLNTSGGKKINYSVVPFSQGESTEPSLRPLQLLVS